MKTEFNIAIIGGGLAGLYAGYKLSQQGIDDYVILEADSEFGGRVKPFGKEGFDLGATWFWGEFQPDLDRLIDELQLPRFNQYEQGDMLVERSAALPPQRMRGYLSSPTSHRLEGGISALIQALKAKQKSTALLSEHQVISFVQQENSVKITALCKGEEKTFSAQKILLALPPRIAANLDFQPALPADLQQTWQHTATWMAPHAKYMAVFDRPFWREQGLSGYAHSQHGPLTEIHDISMQSSERGCLFGFFGVPAYARKQAGEDLLKTHCRNQLVRLYGEQALTHLQTDAIKDWSASPFTATELDQNAAHQHAIAPRNQPNGEWQGKFWGIGSEWSPNFSGYLAGAIEAVDMALLQMGKNNG